MNNIFVFMDIFNISFPSQYCSEQIYQLLLKTEQSVLDLFDIIRGSKNCTCEQEPCNCMKIRIQEVFYKYEFVPCEVSKRVAKLKALLDCDL